MESIMIKEGGVIISLPVGIFPTKNKRLNKIAADQITERLKTLIKNKTSVEEAVEEFAIIIKDNFPKKKREYDRIIKQITGEN